MQNRGCLVMITQSARVPTLPVLWPPFPHLGKGLLEVHVLWGGGADQFHEGLLLFFLARGLALLPRRCFGLLCWTSGLAWRKTP